MSTTFSDDKTREGRGEAAGRSPSERRDPRERKDEKSKEREKGLHHGPSIGDRGRSNCSCVYTVGRVRGVPSLDRSVRLDTKHQRTGGENVVHLDGSEAKVER